MLSREAMVDNAAWFVQARWVVVIFLGLVGVAGIFLDEVIRQMGWIPPCHWPFLIGGLLAMANLGFSIGLRRLGRTASGRAVEVYYWAQLATDLMALTVLVHFVGSVRTFIPVAYLFHITLAGFLLPARNSLVVTGFAGVLYFLCVRLESVGVWPSTSVLGTAGTVASGGGWASEAMALSVILLWFGVWYLVSRLSERVRQRHSELIYGKLVRDRLMLQITHDLKAPLTGIEMHIHGIDNHQWDDMPDEIRDRISKIKGRAVQLRNRIHDMLLLGELRAQQLEEQMFAPVDMRAVVDSVVAESDAAAAGRKVRVTVDVAAVDVWTSERHLRIMLANLLANAIQYSHPGGTVSVRGLSSGDGRYRLSVCDRGIGIPTEALPRIFDEFYRAPEAAAFNRNSTGLGLAIVKRIAQQLGADLEVASEKGQYTEFHVSLPLRKAAGLVRA